MQRADRTMRLPAKGRQTSTAGRLRRDVEQTKAEERPHHLVPQRVVAPRREDAL